MNPIKVKLQIIMILTIVVIGCATTSISDRSVTHSSSRSTTRRTRHHRSSRSSNSNSADYQSQSFETQFKKNADLVTVWKCQTPKPRLVYLNESLNPEHVIEPHMQWFIKAAVLYRCEYALGCCNHPQVCAPSTEQNVTITFKAQNMVDNTFSYPQLQFRNHTSCSCQNPQT